MVGRIDVRLGRLLERVEEFRRESGMETTAQAIRALITLGLDRVGDFEAQWRSIAFNEGLRSAHAKVSARLGETLAAVRSDLET